MAIVKLKDVPVTYVNGRGFGVKVTESHESKGKAFKQQYTLWFDEAHGLNVGDVISVSGFLSAKVGTWEDRDGNERQSVELSINKPVLAGRGPSSPQESGTTEPWATTAPGDTYGVQTGADGFGSEVPF